MNSCNKLWSLISFANKYFLISLWGQTLKVFLTFHLPFSKLDFVSLFQSQELPPDKRVVVWVSVGSYERPPPVHLQHNIKQFSLIHISDIMGLTHNIKQFSLKPIPNIMGFKQGLYQYILQQPLIWFFGESKPSVIYAANSVLSVTCAIYHTASIGW